MSRRRLKQVITVSIIVLVLICAGLYFKFPTFRPGTPAPPPFFQRPAANCVIAFSPDSNRFAFTDDKKVFLCSLAEDIEVRELCAAPEGPIYSIAFTPEAKRLIVSSSGLDIYDIEDGKWLQSSAIRGRRIELFSLCPRSDMVVARVTSQYAPAGQAPVNQQDTLEAFDFNNPDARTQLIQSRFISPVRFSRDGRQAMAFDWDASVIKVWNTSDWSTERDIPIRSAKAFAFGHDCAGIAVGESDGDQSTQCIEWSLSEDRLLRRWQVSGDIWDMEFHPSGDLITVCKHYLLSVTTATTLSLWYSDGQCRSRLRIHDSFIQAFTLSPDGRFVATAGHDKDGQYVKVWRWEQLAESN
jgi:WD40 repeat protein